MAVMRLNFISKELGMATNVTAILPSFDQGFDVGKTLDEVYRPKEKYPVLWLLHGGSGDDADYLNWTNIARYAVEYNCAVICPCDYNAAYSDYPRGAKYYRYITQELRAFIFSRFPSLSDKREDNFIGGLSMGSGGAMKIAMDRCDDYSYALIMSGGISPKGKLTSGHAAFREKIIAAGWPMPKQPSDVTRPDIEALAVQNIEKGRNVPKFILACGESDSIAYASYCHAKELLTQLGYDPITFSLPGYNHEWDFWEIVLSRVFRDWLPTKQKIKTDVTADAWKPADQK
ncbi:MAG: hypothetical protein II713_05235 [Clostridia bacterium]|nr:hypothetical protein [Clostridia bacterium]